MCLHCIVHSVGSSGKSEHDDDVLSDSSYVNEYTSDPTSVAPWCQKFCCVEKSWLIIYCMYNCMCYNIMFIVFLDSSENYITKLWNKHNNWICIYTMM